MAAQTFEEILKFNPYHDARGRFATSNGYATFTTQTKDPKKQHMADMAVARMKQQAQSGTPQEKDNASKDPYINGLQLENEVFDAHKADFNNLSKEEQNAIKRYMSSTGISDSYKNKGLVDQAISQSQLPVNATLTRGVKDLPTTMEEAKSMIGQTIGTAIQGKPISTSIKPDQNWGTATIVIRADKGTRGMYVEVARQSKKAEQARAKYAKEGKVAGEAEFLLPSTTKIKITGVRMGSHKGQDKIIYDAVIDNQVGKSAPTDDSFSIFKTDDDKRLVFGWASISITVDGEQLEDRQNDIIDPEDLEEAAYEYVLNFRDTGEEHISSMRKKGKLVESCVFTAEKQKAIGIPDGILPIGWWIGFKIEDDDAWARVKNGTYKMFSIEGKANRIPVEKGQLIGCGVLVVQDGKILAGTRIERSHRGQICGPGGHIEDGETPEQAAKREAREEFGISCKELTPLGTLKSGRSAIFLCSKFTGTPSADDEEMTEAEWYTIDELRQMNLYPAFEESLDMLGEVEKATPNYDEFPSYDMWLEENLDATIEEQRAAEKHYRENKTVAKTFSEILKFNPFHDAAGRFASSDSFASYSANPKTKAGAMAISRSAQAGHGTTFNVHRESQGENVGQNYRWLNGTGPGAKLLAARGQLASQQPKTPPAPPKPTKNYDSRGFADYDDAPYHQLHSGAKYYAQQNLSVQEQNAAANYLSPNPELGSLYSHCQNMNYMMATGQTLTGQYKKTHDGMMSAMHNIGYNVELTRYDHSDMVNGMLKTLGAGSNYENLSQSALKKALVGQTVNENKFLSTSYNNFKNAPQSTKQIFDSRAVKINYKVKANVQAMMPGKGAGGDFGEIVLAPTNGKANQSGKITDVRLTGQMVRRKGTQMYNQPRIEIDIEIG